MTDKNISSLLELGYGSIADVKQKRLISKEGGSTIQRRGQSILDRFDLYHMLIGMSWMKFHLVVLVLYVSINIIFALAYYLVGVEHLAGIFPKSNWEDFLECFSLVLKHLQLLVTGGLALKDMEQILLLLLNLCLVFLVLLWLRDFCTEDLQNQRQN